MKTAKPILAYTGALTTEALKQLAAAGYVAVPVESLDAIRVIDPLPLASLDPICRAAFDTIEATAYDVVPEKFGRRVARALGTPKPSDIPKS